MINNYLEKYSVINQINTTTIYNMEQLFNETQKLLQKNPYAKEYALHIIHVLGDKPVRQLTTSEKKYWKTKEKLAPLYALTKMSEKYSFEELMKNPYMKEKILFYYFCEKEGIDQQEVIEKQVKHFIKKNPLKTKTQSKKKVMKLKRKRKKNKKRTKK